MKKRNVLNLCHTVRSVRRALPQGAGALAAAAALGLAMAASAQPINPVPGEAYVWYQAIAVGPNANGSTAGDPYVLGTAGNSNGSYVYHWVNGAWVNTGGVGSSVAVSPQGVPWVVTDSGAIYYWNGSTFLQMPGIGSACVQIAVGPSTASNPYGTPWIIQCGTPYTNGTIYRLEGQSWVKVAGGAIQIAVSPSGTAWVVDDENNVYYWNGTQFKQAPASPYAGNPAGIWSTNIAVGPSTSPGAGPNGDVWIADAEIGGLYQLQNGSKWVLMSSTYVLSVSVSPDYGVPWVTYNEIFNQEHEPVGALIGYICPSDYGLLAPCSAQ